MAECCAFSVVSGDSFQYFAPLFIYSTKKAYPEWDVKVYVIGKLRQSCWDILRSPHFEGITGWYVVENAFANFRAGHGTAAAARHLIPKKDFREYKWAYVCDVDFLIFRHDPTHLDYHRDIMKRAGVPYSTFRGPYGKPRRPNITGPSHWRGIYARLAGFGMFRPDGWTRVTKMARHTYKAMATGGEKYDGMDAHRFGSYREYDEVMLHRMCTISGLHTPKRKWQMPDGSWFRKLYRDVHLGDFRKPGRFVKKRKMKRLLTGSNVGNFKLLEKDEHWRAIAGMCCAGASEVKWCLHRLRKLASKR